MASDKIWKVQFSASALEDIVGIVQYLLDSDEIDFARELSGLVREEGDNRLKTMPFRGRIVPELETITKQYREIRIKSYRLIYRAIHESHTVKILMIAHVKRNIQDMLIGRVLIS